NNLEMALDRPSATNSDDDEATNNKDLHQLPITGARLAKIRRKNIFMLLELTSKSDNPERYQQGNFSCFFEQLHNVYNAPYGQWITSESLTAKEATILRNNFLHFCVNFDN
ncbi:hypothetical protein PFISCL1PPCAC_8659, partial [Pristionchus fissidentatus]